MPYCYLGKRRVILNLKANPSGLEALVSYQYLGMKEKLTS